MRIGLTLSKPRAAPEIPIAPGSFSLILDSGTATATVAARCVQCLTPSDTVSCAGVFAVPPGFTTARFYYQADWYVAMSPPFAVTEPQGAAEHVRLDVEAVDSSCGVCGVPLLMARVGLRSEGAPCVPADPAHFRLLVGETREPAVECGLSLLRCSTGFQVPLDGTLSCWILFQLPPEPGQSQIELDDGAHRVVSAPFSRPVCPASP